MADSSSEFLEFQAVCWSGSDVECFDDCGGDDGPPRKQFQIRVFGKTADGRSVCVSVKFTPVFFVEVPAKFSGAHVKDLVDQICQALPEGLRGDVVKASCGLTQRKKFMGFTNQSQFKFAQVVFSTFAAFKAAEKKVRTVIMPRFKAARLGNLALYQSNVDPVLQFVHARDLTTAGWLRVHRDHYTECIPAQTFCAVDVSCTWQHVHALQRDTVAPLVLASFDIEANSADGRSFPDADAPGNEVIQVAVVFQRLGESGPYRRVLLSLGTCDPIDGVNVHCFNDETELLAAFTTLLRQQDTDVLISYNGATFDEQYMYKRAIFHFAGPHVTRFLSMGKLRGHRSTLKKSVLSSAAYGHSELATWQLPGVLDVDLLQVLR